MPTPVQVEIATGRIEGQWRDGVARFLALPYAEPLCPERRLCAPLPRQAWSGVRAAHAPGHAVPQEHAGFLGVGECGEDCLHLNIWSPGLQGQHAVMVWVHGGGFLNGSNAQAIYDGEQLARAQNVVVVSVNYRLGLAGFGDWRAYPELAADTNCGLRDLILALQWVQTQIAVFGGDPQRVTLFGESAGGMAVASLLSVEVARSLFQRAIVQSGSADHIYLPQYAQQVTARMREQMPDLQSLAAASWPQWLRAQRSTLRMLMPRGRAKPQIMQYGMPALPYIDDDLLSPSLWTAARDTRPLLLGVTRDEWSIFLHHPELMGGKKAEPKVLDEADFARLVQRGVPARAAALSAAYSDLLAGESVEARMIMFETDRIFTMSSLKLAEAAADRSWFYRMDWICAGLRQLGACHIVDLPFVFANLDTPWGQFFAGSRASAAALSRLMQDHWGHFAREGCPGGSWPAYGSSAQVQVFSENPHLESDPYRQRREIWQSQGVW